MKKIRVLQIGKYYHPSVGGTEVHLATLVKALKRHSEIKLDILVSHTRARTEIEELNGSRLIRIATLGKIFSLPISLSMPYWMKKMEADISHFHLPNPLSVISYFISRPRGRVIVSYHSDIVRQRVMNFLFDPLLKCFLRKADAIIVTSINIVDNSHILKEFRDKCRVIPHGIDVSNFDFNESVRKKAESIKVKYEGPLVLFVGRLVYYKGLPYLLKAMQDIRARLLVIGSGPLKNRLARKALRLGVSDKVVWLGEVPNDELAPYYHSCDLFVLPSSLKAESFGLVQLEAFACAKPVVSTDLPTGVPLVNVCGRTGLVVSPRDASALFSAVNRLLDSPQLRKTYGSQAKERVEREFTSEKMTERMLEVYKNIISD